MSFSWSVNIYWVISKIRFFKKLIFSELWTKTDFSKSDLKIAAYSSKCRYLSCYEQNKILQKVMSSNVHIYRIMSKIRFLKKSQNNVIVNIYRVMDKIKIFKKWCQIRFFKKSSHQNVLSSKCRYLAWYGKKLKFSESWVKYD